MALLQRAERAGLVAWPALRSVWNDDWVLRAAKGYTKRANSIQCMDPSDSRDIENRLTAFAAQAREFGIRPMFRRTPLAPEGIDALLDGLGWDYFEKSQIRVLPRIASGYEVLRRVDILPATDPDWIGLQSRMAGLDDRTRAILGEILSRLPPDSAGIVGYAENDRPAGTCLAMVVDGVAIFTNVATDRGHRRQGIGQAMMAGGLNFAREHGAETSSIHVLADNAPAIGLYEGFGFERAGDYIYRRAAA